jgi:hypothetical protein
LNGLILQSSATSPVAALQRLIERLEGFLDFVVEQPTYAASDVLANIADTPTSQLEQLLPSNWAPKALDAQAA